MSACGKMFRRMRTVVAIIWMVLEETVIGWLAGVFLSFWVPFVRISGVLRERWCWVDDYDSDDSVELVIDPWKMTSWVSISTTHSLSLR
ncbi:hypothetical protein ASPBRDRAFT_38575 [Aspergillus brasiliensis CBS 101740]|uniref:Transmembrane protein n=1 Tax=Aspergillus brasiliensis (strain CBS 101740 / IMI 381727 / IBT 21946) TaxID=767769 RepID=A0A1L9UWU5_ASPBC|nr:hypothetical protein ASPBRDRAFT_38575 [Aspergillus brasiliensis CBS 101740]